MGGASLGVLITCFVNLILLGNTDGDDCCAFNALQTFYSDWQYLTVLHFFGIIFKESYFTFLVDADL